VVEVYRARGNWRWRIKDAVNSKILGASSEGYKRRIDAIKNIERVGDCCISFSVCAYSERGPVEITVEA
jgi:uncharacterized protein YegP (UPF0339 family)